MVIHSSRVLLKHIWSQSKEWGEPETFSRSFTGVPQAANTSSTPSHVTSLMAPEKRGFAQYPSLPEAGGKRETAEPVPMGEQTEGYESPHPRSLSEGAAETEETFTESQNHRIVGVGRALCGSSSPPPLPKQGHLQ